MPAPSIKHKLLNLPMPQKVIGTGALLALIGAFLPWYKDIDSFNTGDLFFGITGPLYLIGYIIIALSIFALILTGFYLLDKKIPPLPMKESVIYILSGGVTLFLMIIANSVYFHPKFGINITSKEHQIGMLLALIGATAITIGGILQNRESGTSRFIKQFKEETETNEEEVDPVLQLNNFQQEQQKQKNSFVKNEQPEKEIQPVNTMSHAKTGHSYNAEQYAERQKPQTGVREYKSRPDEKDETKVRSEPYPNPTALKREREDPERGNRVNPNSVIRTDL